MLKTIKKLEKEFAEIATAHDQINDFYFGNFLQAYESKRIKHCMMHVDVLTAIPVNIRGAGSYVDLNIIVTVSDIVDESTLENFVDVKSDTLLILVDIINLMETPRWSEIGKIVNPGTATFFQQRGGDLVDGWFINFTFRVGSLRALCDIPLNNYKFETE